MSTTVRVRIALDVICVHSYLGYTRFTRAANRLRAEGHRVQVEFLPFELAPGAGTEGQPLLPVLEQVFGPQAVRQTLRFAEQVAADGLELHYERAVATGTFEAHRLIARAAQQGRAEQMVERLFRAHFTDGLHIGDRATLARLAGEVGVTLNDSDAEQPAAATAPETERLQAELDRVRGLGVSGVPVFFIDGVPPLTGSQPEAALLAALREAAPTA
ncbi:DsbA family oxidoreductase [Streptomyces nodosus]|uniref:DSBA oxidoreductase n=1 Tax=Streptomyces nodosus TaxID=40318 RepID=A0A0B5DSU3_9ACTN|nr:DsbA family protein [Streptomyces nodosus]AJE43661.1 DSBA oxidoreductase [Streptomyces nodosus]MBB4795164.1 putative DsbA family dithiol-disulfide isomerase [Streptomyces nodosus]QEV43572.1 DsbA family oxidoreductase [Streptomyces nodosus]